MYDRKLKQIHWNWGQSSPTMWLDYSEPQRSIARRQLSDSIDLSKRAILDNEVKELYKLSKQRNGSLTTNTMIHCQRLKQTNWESDIGSI